VNGICEVVGKVGCDAMRTRRLDAREIGQKLASFLCEGVVLRSVIVANDGL
jgi:hypothetical protein